MSDEFKNLEFTLQTEKELSNDEAFYLSKIEYLEKIYSEKKSIPIDLKELILNDIDFNKYLVLYINKKLDFIQGNSSEIFTKKIISIINLLSRGNIYQIFKDDESYDYDEIQNLFRMYESSLQNTNSDDEMFDIVFDSYLSLLNAYNKLSIIISIHSEMKESIIAISNILTETINMLKFTTRLKSHHLNNLNNILGQRLYYFSHLEDVNFKTEDLNYLIDKYYLLFEKICDGYNLSKDTGFAGNEKNKELEYIEFKSNSSYLLLRMLKKLDSNFETNKYFICDSLKKCMHLYEKMFAVSFEYDNLTVDLLKKILLDSLSLSKKPTIL